MRGVKQSGRLLAALVVATVGGAVPECAFAQEAQTLISGGIDSGGFGGPVMKFTEVDDRFGLMLGFRGGWIVDHTFVIGAGIYGLANTDNFRNTIDVEPFGSRNELYMGYGGLELEWIVSSHRVVHVSLQSLVGAGGIGFDSDHNDCCVDENVDAFFIVEPGVNVMLNVHRVFRIGLGGSYRFVHDVNVPGAPDLTNESLRGAAGILTLKFGSF